MILIREVMARSHEISDTIYDGRSLTGVDARVLWKNSRGHKEQLNLWVAEPETLTVKRNMGN